ncbi:unnamed protein product [Phaedon cochleariae]|uniref:Uncharacterized protein n=1 Tax=Phaedon cochleariae TaxID=80249 RepID=A0A9N9WYM1_PHACE|nr:unnamed protein product [Phaedon cochleariae]
MDDTFFENITSKISAKVTASIGEQLATMNQKLDNMEAKINDELIRIATVEKMSISNRTDIVKLSDEMDDMEQFRRANSLRFIGVKEEENENVLTTVLSIINNGLKVKCLPSDINNVFRVGKIKNETPKPTRPIVIDFISYMKRNEIFQIKKSIKGSGIYINENLTSARYKLLGQAKEKYGKQEVWSQGGRVCVKQNGTIRMIKNVEDL